MKYMLTWTERPQGSPIEYENAQKRILEVFTQWEAPGNFKIELFVIRVGDWGGYMLLDCDDPTAVHKFCSMLPLLSSKRGPLFLSTMPCASNSKRLPFAMGSNARDIPVYRATFTSRAPATRALLQAALRKRHSCECRFSYFLASCKRGPNSARSEGGCNASEA
jgi:uncharacterized protein DUF3303